MRDLQKRFRRFKKEVAILLASAMIAGMAAPMTTGAAQIEGSMDIEKTTVEAVSNAAKDADDEKVKSEKTTDKAATSSDAPETSDDISDETSGDVSNDTSDEASDDLEAETATEAAQKFIDTVAAYDKDAIVQLAKTYVKKAKEYAAVNNDTEAEDEEKQAALAEFIRAEEAFTAKYEEVNDTEASMYDILSEEDKKLEQVQAAYDALKDITGAVEEILAAMYDVEELADSNSVLVDVGSVNCYFSLDEENSTAQVVRKNASTPAIDTTVTEFYIPEEITVDSKDYDVTSIAENAFKGCTALKTIDIPCTIVDIGAAAFGGCTALERAQLHNIYDKPKLHDKDVFDASLFKDPSNFKFYVPKDSLNSYYYWSSYNFKYFAEGDWSESLPHQKEIAELRNKITAFMETYTVTNSTTRAQVLADVKKLDPTMDDYGELKISYFELTPATLDREGLLKVQFTWDGTHTYTFIFGLTISKLGDESSGSLVAVGLVNCYFSLDEENSTAQIVRQNETTPAISTDVTEFYIPEEITVESKDYDVTSIAANAFNGCTSIKIVDIPCTITDIGDTAFGGCTALEKVQFHNNNNPPKLGSDVFKDSIDANPSNFKFYVPKYGIDSHYNVWSYDKIYFVEGDWPDTYPNKGKITALTGKIYKYMETYTAANSTTKAQLLEEIRNLDPTMDDYGKLYIKLFNITPATLDSTGILEVEFAWEGISTATPKFTRPISKLGDENSSGSGSSGGRKRETTKTDHKKGLVHSITGLITGSDITAGTPGDGYSHWQLDAKGRKLQYADGTILAGTMVTDANGAATEQPAWELINSAWYAFGADGYAKSGLVFDPALNGWFCIDLNTGMKTEWQFVEGTWRYFNPVSDGTKGKMAANMKTPDGYYVGPDGVWDGKEKTK